MEGRPTDRRFLVVKMRFDSNLQTPRQFRLTYLLASVLYLRSHAEITCRVCQRTGASIYARRTAGVGSAASPFTLRRVPREINIPGNLQRFTVVNHSIRGRKGIYPGVRVYG